MIFCECCDAGLRIVDLNPLQLDWVAEASDGGWDEDWEVELELPLRVCLEISYVPEKFLWILSPT